jgi:hypothetical protein
VTRAAAALILLTLASCGPPASDPFSRLTVYDEPGGAYRIRYLAPPWELAGAEGSSANLRIISTTEAYTGRSETGVPDKYHLAVSVIPGGAEASARSDARSAASRMETVVEDVREVMTSSGDSGFELLTLSTMPTMRSRRYVYLDRERAGAVRLLFEANPMLDGREVDEMIRAVDVDPDMP